MRQQKGMASAQLKTKTLNDNPYVIFAGRSRQLYEMPRAESPSRRMRAIRKNPRT